MIHPKVIYDYDPRNLPQEAHAAIGLSVACSAQTEHFVEMAIGGCLGLDAMYMTAVTTHMPMPLRFHVLKAVAEIRIDDLDDLDLLDEILDNIDKAMQKRNDVAHNIWCKHPDTKEIFTTKTTARGTVDTELIPMDISAIKRDADAIYAAGIKLLDFMIAKDLFPSLPTAFSSRAHKTAKARKIRRKKLASK